MFAWASLGMVLISTFTFVLGTFPGKTLLPHFNPRYETTFPEFQKEEETGQPPPYPEAVLVMDVVGSNPVGTFSPLSWFFSIKGGQHWFANIKMCNISENGAVLFFLVEYCIRFPSSTSNLNKSSKFSQYSFNLIYMTNFIKGSSALRGSFGFSSSRWTWLTSAQ